MRVFCALVAAGVLFSAASSAADYSLRHGEIAGAHYTYAQPARWNGSVLLLAHGYRPESAPLVADLSPQRAAYHRLIQEGWIVAKTSYRRNGVIIRDALQDLDELRDEITRHLGRPERVLVEGESMGGLVALLLAERVPENPLRYHGVIALGPALHLREPGGDTSGLTMQPQIPVVFLCNRSEMEAARQYTELRLPEPAKRVQPLLLRVSRDGHININQAERLVALRALNLWLDHGRDALPQPDAGRTHVDVTKVPEPLPSRVFLSEDRRGFTAHVTEVTTVFGNLLLDVQAADFDAIGLPRNAWIEVGIGDKTFRALRGRDFTSVKRGEWVLFENADGFHWLGRNGLNAAAEIPGVQVGDLVHVRRYDPPKLAEP